MSPAVATLAGHDRGPAVAAAEDRVAGVEAQPRLLLVGAMALDAARLEERLNIAREVDGARGRRRQRRVPIRPDERRNHGKRNDNGEQTTRHGPTPRQ